MSFARVNYFRRLQTVDRMRAAGMAEAEVNRRAAEAMQRGPQPVECSVCEWRGRRLKARSAPCPSCGAVVQYR